MNMRCVRHSERGAVSCCQYCGKDFCAECLVDINDVVFCKECVSEMATKGMRSKYSSSYSKPHTRSSGSGRVYSKFLLFILSALPGLGYMYLGLIKRGLFAMMAFFATIFLISSVSGFFGFVLVGIIFATFFDQFRTLNKIRAGIEVEDQIDDILNFARRHRTAVLASIAAVVVFGVIPRLWTAVFFGFNIPPIALIAFGVYFLFFRKRKFINIEVDRDDDEDDE